MQPAPYAHGGKWYIVTWNRGDVPDRPGETNGTLAERSTPSKYWSHDRKKWTQEFALATAFDTEVAVWNHLNEHDVPKS